jgi:CelD/BcsL family acetyltransferase involved in cellulose biosynthesis
MGAPELVQDYGAGSGIAEPRAAAKASPPRFEVTVARNRTDLAKIVPQWEDLALHALEPNPMYEHWMLLPAIEALSERDMFCCVQVWLREPKRPQAQLCGLFPFQRVKRFKGLPVSALCSWSHASWMLCTPLVRAGMAQECVTALLDWVERDGDGASIAEFRYLGCDAPFHGVLADALRESKSMVLAGDSFTRALLRRSATADAYLDAALSSGTRKDLRRKEKRLRERGELKHVVLRSGDDVARWIEDFLRLEASGWKGRQGSALACAEPTRRFAVATLTEAFRRGRLMMMGVDFESRPIARCCNIAAGEGSYAYRTAYDEEFSRYSPGVMAEIAGIREFHAEPGLQWMDSITDPDNITLNRLWKDRRTMQTLVVGVGGWGELWVSMMPMMRWTGGHIGLRRLRAPSR